MTAMITGILARMAPRPAVPGQGVTEARKVTQGPWDRCRSRHQCPCSVAAGGKRARASVLAKSSLKQRHTRWPQGPPSGTAHPYRQAAQQLHYTENLPEEPAPGRLSSAEPHPFPLNPAKPPQKVPSRASCGPGTYCIF